MAEFGQRPDLESWAGFLDRPGHRPGLDNGRLFLLHERNRAALEQLHDKDHKVAHQYIEEVF